MRHELVETLIIGAIIGAVAVFVRYVTLGAPQTRMLTLALVAGALSIVQILLTLRRTNRYGSYDRYSSEQPQSKPRSRSKRSNPFAHELNQSWTGLMPSDTQTVPLDLEQTALISEEIRRDAQQSLDVKVVTVSRRSPSSTTQSSTNDDTTTCPNTSASSTDHSAPAASPDPTNDGS